MTQGLYIGDRFVSFAEAKNTTPNIKQIASRGTVSGFSSLNSVLPNPDPILKKMGKDISVYRDMKSSPAVKGALRRRRAAVKAKAWRIVQGEASEQITDHIRNIFNKLQVNKITGAMCDGSFYGYQPCEIRWAAVDGAWIPADVEAMPPEWYFFDPNNDLRFRHKDYGQDGMWLAPGAYLLPRQDPTYSNPYGEPDAAACFWDNTFLQGGQEFWVRYTEKYGSPWLIGKYGSNYTPEMQETLLNNLYAMVQDAVAVIPDNSNIQIIEAAGKAASADVYERFLTWCRSSINIALLGQNQSTEADSTHASATAGAQVADEISDGDCEMVAEQWQKLIDLTVEYNWSGPSPQFEFFDDSNGGTEQAERDTKLASAGARFTPQYFKREYGLQEGDLDETPVEQQPANVAFAEQTFTVVKPDYASAHTDQLAAAAAPHLEGMIDRLRRVVKNATSLQGLQDDIVTEFSELDTGELVKVMQVALTAAELDGRAGVIDGD